MAGEKFNSKTFNPQAFGRYIETVPKLRLNQLINANIFRSNSEIRNAFANQTGTSYAVLPMYGRISGDTDNYDGQTDITSGNMNTYERGVVTFGRAKRFEELDFSYDITGGVDFMSQVANQVAEYWDDKNEDTLIAIINGIFGMTSTGGAEFVEKHTYDITAVDDGLVTGTTFNSAIQKASGDKKQRFSMLIMNSHIATNLENQNLVEYLKYTSPEGIQSNTDIAQMGNKLILVDDAFTYDEETSNYITYVLGQGCFDYEDLGVKVPYEMDREPAVNGGKDYLYTRERLCIAPYGISYLKANQASLSPTDDELADGANWDLVNDGEDETTYFDHKEIAIAKIVSLG